jgi:hypothetical protein
MPNCTPNTVVIALPTLQAQQSGYSHCNGQTNDDGIVVHYQSLKCGHVVCEGDAEELSRVFGIACDS